MKTIVKSTLILVAITLIAGLSLAAVYEITKDPIVAAEQRAKENAYRMVMPDAASFVEIGTVETEQYPVDIAGILVNECLTANDVAGNFLGYAINVTSPNGYGGNITIAVGISADSSITGISVIAQSETAGLGAVCADKKFTDQFIGIKDYVEYVKTGKTEPHEIDAISGATITTKAVTEAVNTALAYASELKGGND